MRKGFNPNKDKKIRSSEYIHQVIMPVHIPHFENYYRDSFEILVQEIYNVRSHEEM